MDAPSCGRSISDPEFEQKMAEVVRSGTLSPLAGIDLLKVAPIVKINCARPGVDLLAGLGKIVNILN